MSLTMLRRAAIGVAALTAVAWMPAHGASAATTTTISEFPIPTANAAPEGVAVGADGNLWFTEALGDKIGQVTPSGVVTEFSVPTAAGFPARIAAGPDGNLWFTESSGNNISRITPSGAITEFGVPTPNSSPLGIAAGPDGNLWFTESSGNNIGRITLSGSITEFPLPTAGSAPAGITAGPDGNVWFAEFHGPRIGRITPSGAVAEFPTVNAQNGPTDIAAGTDGNLWFTEEVNEFGSASSSSNTIERMTPSGTITQFPIPTARSFPFGITSGPDGNLWFTESRTGQIGRITPSGGVTELTEPAANSEPLEIATGPDGNVWFTELQGDQIGRVDLADNDLVVHGVADVTTVATGPAGAVVTYPLPTASDDVGENPAVTCDDPSGSTFAVGTTTVICATSDGDAPVQAEASFRVTVIDNDLALQGVPANITTNATGSAGAPVAYSPPTASDEGGQTPAVACDHPSGSTFAIGATTVTCSAPASDGDDANTPATATFTVTVRGAAPQLTVLSAAVQGVGPGTSLSDKVSRAQSQLATSDAAGACSTLGALINEVQAQSAKSIGAAEAGQLITDVRRIQAVLGC